MMRYLRTFLKRWYLYLIPLLIPPIVMTILGYQALMLYSSTALLYVDQPVFLTNSDFGWNQYLSPAQNEAGTMSELLQSQSFLAQIASKTDLAKSVDLTSRAGQQAAYTRFSTEVTVAATGTGPNTLVLTVIDKSPQIAQQFAQSALDTFAVYYQAHRQQLDQQGIAFYQQQLQSAQGQLTQDNAQLSDYLQRHPGLVGSLESPDPTVAQLQFQVNQDRTTVANLTAQVNSLQEDMHAIGYSSTDFFTVMDHPQVPLRPTLQKKKLFLYTGEGLGIGLGIVGLFVVGLTMLDRRIYYVDDLRKIDEELELDVFAIESLPALAGIKRRSHQPSMESSARAAILLPVLAALPRVSVDDMPKNGQYRPGAADTSLLDAGEFEAGE
jgi:uncharacterized protein involved in exopolysaccharide biosynthesis